MYRNNWTTEAILFGTVFAHFAFNVIFTSLFVLYEVLKQAASYFRAA
jgi:hypothetical protein